MCLGSDLILEAYCRDSFACLAPKLGSYVSTYKLATGEENRQEIGILMLRCMYKNASM